MERKHISLKEKLAAALYEVGRLRAIFPRPDGIPRAGDSEKWTNSPVRVAALNGATADEMIALFHWDHNKFHAYGGSDIWQNLNPLLIEDHREKTRRDIAIIAKGKRIRRKEAAHKSRLNPTLVIPLTDGERRRPSRPFPKRRKAL